MNDQRKSFSIVACFLALCFASIMMYVSFEVLSLLDVPGGMERIAFSAINSIIIIGLASLGGVIQRLTTAATLVQLWCIAVLYTIFQFGAMFVGINAWRGKPYVIYQLVILFLCLCIALPMLNISHQKKTTT